MKSQHAGLARRLSLAAIVVLSGIVAVACNPADPADQIVVKKHAAANWVNCGTITISGTPDTVALDTDFDVAFLVDNGSGTTCNNGATPTASSAAISTVGNQNDTPITILADDETEFTGHYHSGTGNAVAYALLAVSGHVDSIEIVVGTGGGYPPPTSFTASSVDSGSALLGWTNGAVLGGTLTHIQYRVHNGTWPGGDSSLVGSSMGISPLSPSTTYDVRGWHTKGGNTSDTTYAPSLFTTTAGAPAAPTSLGSASVAATFATVTWTNGSVPSGTTTQVQVRASGDSWPSGGGTTVADGVASLALTGLTRLTTYDVRMWHQNGAVASDTTTATSLFTTIHFDPGPTITGFTATCTPSFMGGKNYNVFSFSWSTAATVPSGYSWEIGVSTSSDSSSASSYATGDYTTQSDPSAEADWANGTTNNKYFWIRYDGTAWYPLDLNPLAVQSTTACAV